MKTTAIVVGTVLLLVFVIDLAYSQKPTTNNGNPSSAKNNTSVSDTTNNDNTLNKPPTSISGKPNRAGNGKARQPNARPNRRRTGRRMRRRRKNRQGRRNKKKTTVAPVKTTPGSSMAVDTMRGQAKDIGIKGTSALRNDPKVGNTANKLKRKPAKVKPASNPDDLLGDDFFRLFNEQSTSTEPPNTNASPPAFDPNKKPGEKRMPVVDESKAIAHDGQPCNATYKSHGTIKTKYMMKYAEGVWETLNCPPNLGTGLVWRQDLCACGEELVPQDPNDWCGLDGFNPDPENKHNYIRKHHGANAIMFCNSNLVWSQTKCQCIYDPTVGDRPIEQRVTFTCKTILQLEFEGNLTNTADGYQIQTVKLHRRGRLPRIRYMKTRGAKEKAAMIVSQPLEFQAYRGNDFQTQVTYSINFKVSPLHKTNSNFMTLLTDLCLGNFGRQNKERKPSFSLTFQPNTKSFRLQFRTEMTDIDQIITGAQPDNNGWYKTVVYFEDATVNLENNGIKLFSVADIYGKVPQNKCPLFIAGRGPGYDRSKDFYGYMDNVFLVKDCKFHEANIKFL